MLLIKFFRNEGSRRPDKLYLDFGIRERSRFICLSVVDYLYDALNGQQWIKVPYLACIYQNDFFEACLPVFMRFDSEPMSDVKGLDVGLSEIPYRGRNARLFKNSA